MGGVRSAPPEARHCVPNRSLDYYNNAAPVTELGQAIFTPGVILEMILAESGRSSAGGARGSLRAYAQDDCVLPSTHFPNLTDLRRPSSPRPLRPELPSKASLEAAARYADRLIATLSVT